MDNAASDNAVSTRTCLQPFCIGGGAGGSDEPLIGLLERLKGGKRQKYDDSDTRADTAHAGTGSAQGSGWGSGSRRGSSRLAPHTSGFLLGLDRGHAPLLICRPSSPSEAKPPSLKQSSQGIEFLNGEADVAPSYQGVERVCPRAHDTSQNLPGSFTASNDVSCNMVRLLTIRPCTALEWFYNMCGDVSVTVGNSVRAGFLTTTEVAVPLALFAHITGDTSDTTAPTSTTQRWQDDTWGDQWPLGDNMTQAGATDGGSRLDVSYHSCLQHLKCL